MCCRNMVNFSGTVSTYFNGQLYQNNSIISATDIENHLTSPPVEDSLVCLANHPGAGWYNPSGVELPVGFESGSFYQANYTHQSAMLHRSVATPDSFEGLFHCQITNTLYLYIGIYSRGTGKF
jgi:hypothetical protein